MNTQKPRPEHYIDPSDFGQAARVQRQQLAADLAESAADTVPVSQTTGFVSSTPAGANLGGTYITSSQFPPTPCPGTFEETWRNGNEVAGEPLDLRCNVCYKKVNIAHLSNKQINLMEALLSAIGHFRPAPPAYITYNGGAYGG